MTWELPEGLGPDLVRDGREQLQMPAHLEGKTKGIKIDHPLGYGAERVIMCTCNQLLRDTDWASMIHSL